MSDAATVAGASEILKQLWPNGKVSERIRNAAIALRWTYTRTSDLWYAQAHTIKGHETLKLERLKAERAAKAEEAIRIGADEYEQLTEKIGRMEAMLTDLMARLDGPASRPQW